VAEVETKEKEKTLEEAFEELEGVLKEMEGEDVPLEKSFSLFLRGTKLIKECNSKIDRVEKEVQIITEQGSLADFETAEE
jgi:exodeoxyribonuclease VII small subunit